eukprot:Rhum_TRINITY_DN14847_c17_g1::Rhum_TRINITY_DN14847_c17_g1_i1::g.125767::m.125767/K08333/PIK3R4, VPS15; phosphoinositide-3-kinase, regulatory subunit 4
MGNQLAMGVDLNPSDIYDGLKSRAPLGGGKGRLLKSMHCASEDGDVVCKMFLKTDERDDQVLENQARRLKRCEHALNEMATKAPDRPSNVCFYSVYRNLPWSEMKAAYLVRTYFRYSLQERIMTRPFLTTESKLWLSYQLLLSVSELHAARIAHGDLKVTNVMVTSLGWLYVTDIAPFKPSHVKPADFSYYFDSAENRHCSLAPERFVDDERVLTEKATEAITEKMDVFGAGCAIAQLFLGGEPLFKLDQLLAYKNGKFSPREELADKIEQPGIVDMIMSLIEADPDRRSTARECIATHTERGVFPTYYQGLHQNIVGPLVNLTPDKRAIALSTRLPKITEFVVSGEPDGDEAARARAVRGAAVILSTVLCGTMQHCLVATNRVACLNVMVALSKDVGDDCNLQQLLPYAVTMMKDKWDLVRATAVKAVAVVVKSIESFPPGEANLFDDYVLGAIEPLASDKSVIVRAALAEHLPEIAHHARRFLETRQLLVSSAGGSAAVAAAAAAAAAAAGGSQPFSDSYDQDLRNLQDLFEGLVRTLVIGGDVNPWVNRAFLSDITKLCVFFGRQRTNDFILPTLTIAAFFLNAPDFQVRMELHKQLVGIALYVGPSFLISYILPCLKEGLLDYEEIVVHEALQTLSKLTRLGMLGRKSLTELCEAVTPLLLHPSYWIRTGALDVFAAVEAHLEEIDVVCFVFPVLRPFLQFSVPELRRESLAEALLPPLPRKAFDDAVSKSNPAALASALDGAGGTEAEASLRKQLLQKYLENMVRSANRSKEDVKQKQLEDSRIDLKEWKPNSRMIRNMSSGHAPEDFTLLNTVRQLEFGIAEVEATEAAKGQCPRLGRVCPTHREHKRMQLKAVAAERRASDAWVGGGGSGGGGGGGSGGGASQQARGSA